MREILFRGKFLLERKGWTYGGYVHQTDNYGDPCDLHLLVDGTTTEDNEIGYAFAVNPKTLGQFTGFLDVNGQKIFEGDIVKRAHSVSNPNKLMIVEWHRGSWRLFDYQENEDFLSNWCNSHYLNGKDIGGCVVIGNIHDNPELMKAEGE